mmetsp:Transcript_5121/g.21037  ORF Transcript_5121/g.21037 Transcript_5121/m.21037 type:complete len:333 (+) Transcript_5121:460-1458(+)
MPSATGRGPTFAARRARAASSAFASATTTWAARAASATARPSRWGRSPAGRAPAGGPWWWSAIGTTTTFWAGLCRCRRRRPQSRRRRRRERRGCPGAGSTWALRAIGTLCSNTTVSRPPGWCPHDARRPETTRGCSPLAALAPRRPSRLLLPGRRERGIQMTTITSTTWTLSHRSRRPSTATTRTSVLRSISAGGTASPMRTASTVARLLRRLCRLPTTTRPLLLLLLLLQMSRVSARASSSPMGHQRRPSTTRSPPDREEDAERDEEKSHPDLPFWALCLFRGKGDAAVRSIGNRTPMSTTTVIVPACVLCAQQPPHGVSARRRRGRGDQR